MYTIYYRLMDQFNEIELLDKLSHSDAKKGFRIGEERLKQLFEDTYTPEIAEKATTSGQAKFNGKPIIFYGYIVQQKGKKKHKEKGLVFVEENDVLTSHHYDYFDDENF